MPRTYRHLSQRERDLIAVLKSRGESLRAIARRLKRDPGTISRELRRNSPPVHRGYYLPHKAQARARARWAATHRRARLKTARLAAYVRQRLAAGWSPELISGRLKRLKLGASVSHETIYRFIYAEARELIHCLARSHRRRLPRGHSRRHRKSHIPGRISIGQRPARINRRRQAGHWEVDTAVSRAGPAALAVAAERKTRYTRLKRLPRKTARQLRVALNRSLSHYPARLRRSLTYDNGPENTEHQVINAALGTRSYFCEPFHSWEKGTVENTVGLVRRFYPKGTDFTRLPARAIKRLERWLNHRPRKCLDYQTPAEAFRRECCT
jgi:IS30 family transposase